MAEKTKPKKTPAPKTKTKKPVASKPVEKKEKSKGGRPPHEPTKQTRASVELMSAFGIKQELIAGALGIHRETLMIHYRDELDLAQAKLIANVGQALYTNATKNNNVVAQIFLSKAIGKLRENAPIEPPKKPRPQINITRYDPAKKKR